ncbi:SDR family oxidoreductase [Alphaproteobacteria bacterium]|nr:SDR family oxidoreductase [Alphaproteobacteria bacterium]
MNINKKVLITGGGGYVGSNLVPKLLELDYEVLVYDLFIYGEDVIDNHKNLKKIKADIRDLNTFKKTIKDCNSIIHLACISNDPSFELNPTLGRSINLDSFDPIVKISKDSGVERFIYASSSSVYGVKKENEVHENMSLEPLTDYSKYKAMCEDILQNYKSNEFIVTTLRPATVCGYAKRQRLDVIVNILTNLAYNKSEITVFGGDQLRPNININDMSDAYVKILQSDKNLINGETFNVGLENYSVNQLAEIVIRNMEKNIKTTFKQTNDNRSYHISSKKIMKLIDFKFNYSIEDAVIDLKKAFDNNQLIDPLKNEFYFNIKRMNSINLK